MLDWPRIGSFLDLCAVYLTTQLVRCAAFSLVLTGLVMLLRKMLFSERIFLKGMLWAVFLVTPFLGKLKLFYENAAICKVLSCKLDAPVPCRLDAPDFGFVCHVLADCLHQHQQVI